MKLPELQIENVNIWESPGGILRSRPRFVLRYELECYLGEVGETWIDGVHYRLQRGSILFSRPGQLRFSAFPFAARFLYFDVKAASAEFGHLLATLPNVLPPRPVIAAEIEHMERLFGEGGYRAELELQNKLLHCLLLLSREAHETVPREGHPKQGEVFVAIRYMKEHLYSACTVADFAAQTGYSVPHFTAFFRELLGTTPYEYYTRLKLQEAQRLLLDGKHNTREVADLLGYSSGSHFCAAFRAVCGQTPQQYVASVHRGTVLSDELT